MERVIEAKKEIVNDRTQYKLKEETKCASLGNRKIPEWHMRSPIQDIFFRYGEYFS